MNVRSRLVALGTAAVVLGAVSVPSVAASPSTSDAVNLPSCDGSYEPRVPSDVSPETRMAWVVMGVEGNGNSLWVGTKRAVKSRYLCATRTETQAKVEIEIWATYPFSDCFINEFEDRECTQDDTVGHELDEQAQPYVVPLTEPLNGRRITGARRTTVKAPLARPFNFYASGRLVAIPPLVGLSTRDAREVTIALGFGNRTAINRSGTVSRQRPSRGGQSLPTLAKTGRITLTAR